VFRTDSGGKLDGLDRSPRVCFEVDGTDLHDHTGWSVLVKGRAAELVTTDELRHVASLPLRLWSLGQKSHWICIRPTEVTGRSIRGH
jgi:nitroimidazol reductase NimA-like FMN-containing flavoprotein (pyridoxamine 5'-phosphate oxidase superfamily)